MPSPRFDSSGERCRTAAWALRRRLKQDPDPKIRRDAMALLGRLTRSRVGSREAAR
jgi:hypothetical protein